MPLRIYPSFIVIGVIATLLLLLTFRSSWKPDSFATLSPWTYQSQQSTAKGSGMGAADVSSEIGRAGNATLGFEKVIVINLKERSDKKDAIALQASLTGFNVEWLDAAKGEEIPDKALPPGLERGKMPVPYIGSWRSHINAIRSILEQGLTSALIMEDDVDWDVRLLSQMRDFAQGTRTLQNLTTSNFQNSPYGDDWDVLWPGHCGEVLPTDDDRRYVIKDDETVAPKEHQGWLKALKDYPDHTRIIHKTGAPICTFAYAVSARGAQKILLALAMKGSNLGYDNQLAFLCQGGYLNIKCYSVQPMLFFHHRPAGAVDKDSDLQSGDHSVIREKGFTENIVLSARLNLEQMILGTKDYVMQW